MHFILMEDQQGLIKEEGSLLINSNSGDNLSLSVTLEQTRTGMPLSPLISLVHIYLSLG